MVRLQRNIIKGIKPLYFFSERNFAFKMDKLVELFNELDADDKIAFNFDYSTIDWDDFVKNSLIAGRKLLFKEGPETIPAAQERLRKLYFINLGIRTAFYSLVAGFAYTLYSIC